jgi:predicted nucleic acid-binding protein
MSLSILLNSHMKYIDTDVLIHSLVNQNPDLHLKIVDLIKEVVGAKSFFISWLSIQEVGFVLAKLGQPTPFYFI